jgi:ankyrin repeat protein
MVCAQGVLVDAQLLLAAGADPALEGMAEQGGQRFQLLPLSAASLYGHIEVVRLLSEQDGVDPQQVTTDIGTSAFFCACHGGHLEVAQLLLLLGGVDVNQARTDVGVGDTPLYVACDGGHTEVVRMLLACEGIAVNQARTDNGVTPLCTACFHGHTEVVRMLLACEGIAVNQARTDGGTTPLYVACDSGHTEVARMLLACEGIAVNQARTDDGATPLHAAAYNGHLATAQQLVVFGADTTATDDNGTTPFQDATDQEHPALVGWFGAVKQWSPLRVAAGCRLHTSLTIQLKQGRMDPDATLAWSEMQLARATATTPATELPWGDAPGLCSTTTKLIKTATRGWAPTAHWLHHANIRMAVRTVLLVSERLHVQSVAESVPSTHRRGRSATVAAAAFLPILPPEMWVAAVRFLLRRHWPVSPLLPAPQ